MPVRVRIYVIIAGDAEVIYVGMDGRDLEGSLNVFPVRHHGVDVRISVNTAPPGVRCFTTRPMRSASRNAEKRPEVECQWDRLSSRSLTHPRSAPCRIAGKSTAHTVGVAQSIILGASMLSAISERLTKLSIEAELL